MEKMEIMMNSKTKLNKSSSKTSNINDNISEYEGNIDENLLCCSLLVSESEDETDIGLTNKIDNEHIRRTPTEILIIGEVESETKSHENINVENLMQENVNRNNKEKRIEATIELNNMLGHTSKDLSIDGHVESETYLIEKEANQTNEINSMIISFENNEHVDSKDVINRNIKCNELESNKISSIIDADTESDNEEISDILSKTSDEPGNTKVKTINQIKSGTQKMYREQQITVPYHKPRNLTLKEFMARKSIANSKINRVNFSLKMNENVMKDYVAYLKERELESQTIFTSTENNEVKKKFGSDIKEFSKIAGNCLTNENFESLENNITEKTSNNLQEQSHMTNLNSNVLDNVNKELSSKVEIISDIKISPALEKSFLNIGHLKQLIMDDKDICNHKDQLTLKGNSSLTIDLGNNPFFQSNHKKEIDILFQNFLKASGKKVKIPNSSPNISFSSKNLTNDSKPPSSYFELRNNLKKIIVEHRLNDLGKKIQNFKKDMEIVGKICDDDDNDDDSDSFNEEFEQNVLESDEDNCIITENDVEEDADDEFEENNKVNKKKTLRRKKNVLRTLVNNSDDSDDEQLINSEMNVSRNLNGSMGNFTPSQDKTSNNPIKDLCEDKQHVDENELIYLCSGNFETTQLSTVNNEKNEENLDLLITSICSPINEDVPVELCFDGVKKVERKNPSLVSSDEENTHKKISRHFKRNKKIYYSDEDDEKLDPYIHKQEADEVNSVNKNISISSNDEINEYEEIDEIESSQSLTDNDTNECFNKKNLVEKASDYVENEAILSESDWDSADEDEKNLDTYDIELGDEDEYDQTKLKDELAKIHMTKLMDRDASEIKKIEEMLFVDEENHGLNRQRQFKWKSAKDNFTLDISKPNDDETFILEEDDEEQWRKMKHEREQLLENKQDESLTFNNINLGDNTKIISIKKLNASAKTEDSSFLISQSLTSNVRGSFLMRDNQTLSRVAKISTNCQDLNSSGDLHKNIDTINKNVLTLTDPSNSKKRKSVQLESNESKKSKMIFF